MDPLLQVAGVGHKTLQLLNSNDVMTVEQLSQVNPQTAKDWGITNIKQIVKNAAAMVKTTALSTTSNPFRQDRQGTLVSFSQHSWYNQRVYLPVITSKDNGEFSTVVFCVVIKNLTIENRCNLGFQVEFQRASQIQSSPLVYSPVFVASLNPTLPILHISVNKKQCEIYLVLKSVWEANVYLTMHANKNQMPV